jgi:hypothetical protein
MSRETAVVTTYRCNSCGSAETVGGEFPETIMDEKGWAYNQSILGNVVDLCKDCVSELKAFIRWEEPSISLSALGSCCCSVLKDGTSVCEPCAENNHKGCVGPL